MERRHLTGASVRRSLHSCLHAAAHGPACATASQVPAAKGSAMQARALLVTPAVAGENFGPCPKLYCVSAQPFLYFGNGMLLTYSVGWAARLRPRRWS